MDLAPHSAYIKAIRAQHNLGWTSLLAELIDNALDACSSSITIDFSVPGEMTASDDGPGVADLRMLLAPGYRQDHATTDSGRFGIGAKEAMICLGRASTVVSVHRGVMRSVSVDWTELERSGSWKVNDPVEQETQRPSGTSITVSSFLKSLPDWKLLISALGRGYAPAITAGSFQIRLRRKGKGVETVQPAPLPLLEREEYEHLTFPNGKSADVRMGIIIRPDERSLQGITVAIKGRIIQRCTRIGLDSPAPGLYGYVILSKNFSLSKNKDRISSADAEMLGDAIKHRFSSLIEYARKSGEDVLLSDCNRVLNLLPTAVRRERDRRRKAKRSSPVNNPGAVIPTGRGGSHQQATKTQSGTRFPGREDDGCRFLQIQRDARGQTNLLTLEDDNHTVFVNTDHPFYGKVNGNMDILTPMVIVFFASQMELRGQKLLNFKEVIEEQSERHSHDCSYLLERYIEARDIAQQSIEAAG